MGHELLSIGKCNSSKFLINPSRILHLFLVTRRADMHAFQHVLALRRCTIYVIFVCSNRAIREHELFITILFILTARSTCRLVKIYMAPHTMLEILRRALKSFSHCIPSSYKSLDVFSVVRTCIAPIIGVCNFTHGRIRFSTNIFNQKFGA